MGAPLKPRVRGQCSVCLGKFTVKLDGTVLVHHAVVYLEAAPLEMKRCPGSNEPPRPARPLWR